MEISDILDKLGLDLKNPEVRRGAIEAIDAILASRIPMPDTDLRDAAEGGAGVEQEIELDPDLLQPSVKQSASNSDNEEDIEIEDEEDILSQIKHNESEDPVENKNSNGDESESDEESKNNNDDNNAKEPGDSKQSQQDESDEEEPEDSDEDSSNKNNYDDYDDEESDETDNSIDNDSDSEDTKDDVKDDTDGDYIETDSNDIEDVDGEEDFDDDIEDDEGDGVIDNVDADDLDELEDDDSDDEEESDDKSEDDGSEDDDFEFDEEDIVDKDLFDTAEDEEEKTKFGSRKLKRERTLAAAKQTLADAKSKRTSKALINELEKAIEALEALTEAVNKSLKDISDDEFNLLVNRVLDAMDACGNSGLTYTSDEERQAQVKEIKNDLAKSETQNELAGEDAAKIRAETQAIKAREKELDKYKTKSAGSFKGFQEFLNSLYRAIALQVSKEDNRVDSWSALSRRNSGAGVLRQGQKISDLPNKKIPIIDFYFDCSASWENSDIDIGMEAVQSIANLEAEGKIKINIYYFSNDVFTDMQSARNQGGTRAWNKIVKNIIATDANNVIIMTDSDMENAGKFYGNTSGFLQYTVPGFVWYLWKNGDNAPRLPRDLKGRGGVLQFAFDA